MTMVQTLFNLTTIYFNIITSAFTCYIHESNTYALKHKFRKQTIMSIVTKIMSNQDLYFKIMKELIIMQTLDRIIPLTEFTVNTHPKVP